MQVRIPDMDLRQIAASGQCFRMEEREPGLYSIIAGSRYLEARQIPAAEAAAGNAAESGERKGAPAGALFEFSCGPEEFASFWQHYFDLETDYGRIKEKIAKRDTYLQKAAQMGWGIRILNQDLWEMIITFIISQQNNIPRIRRCIRLLCQRYGEAMTNCRGETFFAFPKAEALAVAEPQELRACNLGYRARYIQETARMVAEDRFSMEALRRMKHEEAREELRKLCGVGIKVAECVCLFALHHTDAFPVDTHIAQVLEQHYPNGFPFGRYRGTAGIMQQYIFFFEVNQGAPPIWGGNKEETE